MGTLTEEEILEAFFYSVGSDNIGEDLNDDLPISINKARKTVNTLQFFYRAMKMRRRRHFLLLFNNEDKINLESLNCLKQKQSRTCTLLNKIR